jgi:hypothetical protein
MNGLLYSMILTLTITLRLVQHNVALVNLLPVRSVNHALAIQKRHEMHA